MSLDKDDTFCSGSSSLTKLDDGLELAQISESQLSLGSSSLTKLDDGVELAQISESLLSSAFFPD